MPRAQTSRRNRIVPIPEIERLRAALRRPEAYPHPATDVEVYETHVSLVFVAGDRAYKLKKPVRFPFLDYSTLERRCHFCEEEVRLNRRLAPDVYEGVVPVTADLRVKGDGEAVEYLVAMKRLPHDRMLDELLARDEVAPGDVERIADVVAAFHARAPRADAYGDPARIRDAIESNLRDAAPHVPPPWHARIARDQDEAFRAHDALLRRRAAEGRIRDVHGDLHAANVCLAGDVVIYDCIEFEEAFRCVDVAAEVAFLAMDLERHGAWDLARRFVARYVERSGDRKLEVLQPLYRRHRACVRGLVESLRGRTAGAHDYFRLAASYARGPFVVLTCGLPGVGKTHVARRVARAFGAELLRSDVVRKELVGLAPTEHWTGGYAEGPYAPEVTGRTYGTLRDRARERLANGRRVVVDATFPAKRWRDLFEGLGAPRLVVHVTCAEEVVERRLRARAEDPDEVSDARMEVYREARARFEPPDRAIEHDGAGDSSTALDAIVDALVS